MAEKNEEPTAAEREFVSAMTTARVNRSISQTTLASQMRDLGVEIEQVSISRIESGHRSPRLGEAIAIAAVLDIPLLAAARRDRDSRLVEAVREHARLRAQFDEDEARFKALARRMTEARDLIWELQGAARDADDEASARIEAER
jgi:DNA-binding XRE family transcriptional regulator